MKKRIQARLNNEKESAVYFCPFCLLEVTKVSRVLVPLPPTQSEYCPRCGCERVFKKKTQ